MSEQINSATKFLASAAAETLIDGVHSVGVPASPGLTGSVGQSGQPEIASNTDTETIEKLLIAQLSGNQLPASFAEASDVLVKRLADKSLLRMVNRLAKEQFRLETIFANAGEKLSSDPRRKGGRKIDSGWLERFIFYAAEVNEDTILDVPATALSEAAIDPAPLLSPRALDTLRFFRQNTFEAFMRSARLLRLLGQVPLSYVENEERSGLSANDLELMLELGLFKVESFRYFVVPVGDVFITFSYLSHERFSFDVVRLTQIGREIIDLKHRDLRTIQEAMSAAGTQGELWKIQTDHDLSDKEVVGVVRSLIQDMADRWSIDITAFLRTGDKNQKVFSRVRREMRDKFELAIPSEAMSAAPLYNQSIIQNIAEEFASFDDYELEELVAHSILSEEGTDAERP